MLRRGPVLRRLVGFALVLATAAAAAAQPAPPRPRPPQAPRPAKSAANAGDRSELPFNPLQSSWSFTIGVQPSAPLATNGLRLFVPFSTGALAFIDLVTGTPLFSKLYPTTLAPVVADARLLVTGDAVIDAVLADDGAALWKTPLPGPAAYAPVARSGWAFVAIKTGVVVGLRSDTGAIVWTQTPGGPPTAPLVVEGDRVYGSATGGTVHALAVADGQPVWRVTLDSDVTALAAVAGHVFAATAGRWLYALDARKGEVRWRYRIGGPAIGLAVDEDRVVAVMLDQSVRAFKIGSGAQAWRQELSFRPMAGPIIAGRSVLVTGFAPNLRILDRRTGANVGLYAVPIPSEGPMTLETLASAPFVWEGATPFDDLVVLITQHGWLHVARRTFDTLPTPIAVWPGTPVAGPEPPPGWVPPAPAIPPATPLDPATGAIPPATPAPATPTPATPTPASAPPVSSPPAPTPPAPDGTASRTPPASSAR